MPKDIDPHGTTKQNNRWAEKRSGKPKGEDAESKQNKILERAREIAKKKNAKKD
ncbi:MAG: hypothetical protein ACM3P0_11895 [Acidobacteriota bacterium]